MISNKYYDLVNEGGEGYRPPAAEKDSRMLAEKIFWLKSDLDDAETDGLNYKAGKIREQIAALEAQQNGAE